MNPGGTMNRDIYVVVEHLRGQVADITYVALGAARALTAGTGGEVVGVLLGHEAEGLTADLAADRVLSIDDPALADFTPDSYTAALAGLIGERLPRVVVFGDTSIGAGVAGLLSGRLQLPLVGKCHTVRIEDGEFGLVSQICGGKIFVETAVGESTVLVTMVPGGYKAELGRSGTPPVLERVDGLPLEDSKVTVTRYIEPESGDVDITAEDVLVAIGRGIQLQDNVELAEELAEALGGVVCASRPIIDQGWLPSSRMVGKSGKRVKPAVYLALGISGAPEHVEGMTDSAVVIAVNIDPAAPIFDAAHFGTETDLLDLMPELIERVKEARAG